MFMKLTPGLFKRNLELTPFFLTFLCGPLIAHFEFETTDSDFKVKLKTLYIFAYLQMYSRFLWRIVDLLVNTKYVFAFMSVSHVIKYSVLVTSL